MGSTKPTPVPTRKTAAMMPQSAVRRARLVEPVGTGLDLNQQFGIDQAADSHQRGHRLDGADDFTMRRADLPPASRHGGEDSRPGHVVKAGTDASKRLAACANGLADLNV